ncbi:hypothetical protein HYG86_14915 [Alkalicella caledoniensis]|uniref:Uncharacterized protein n=1 Tax=Alkalicella caledoniensis TaxID=2731377 RepID=A0A7G9WBA3_ALKCA|nr:hypothetical protein [Alkalicella caledoniensis]QNO15965.1 hypothetical protein HYG86_14915 [Alkalicella caledoniensis]
MKQNKIFTLDKLMITWVITLMVALSLAFLLMDSYYQNRKYKVEEERSIGAYIAEVSIEAKGFVYEVDTRRSSVDLDYWNLVSFGNKIRKADELGLKDFGWLYDFVYSLVRQYDITDDIEEKEMLLDFIAEVHKDIITMTDIYRGKSLEDVTWSENFRYREKVQGKDKEFNKERDELFRGLHDRYYIEVREQLGAK